MAARTKKTVDMYDDDNLDYKNGIDNEEEEDKDGTSTDAVWRQNRILHERCKEYELRITKLTTELRLSKSHERQTKRQIKIITNGTRKMQIWLTRCHIG